MRTPPAATALWVAALLLTACAAPPPAPREARLDGGGAPEARSVDGVVGSALTLAEIREGYVEPRCAEAGLVMATLRVRRQPDGSQAVQARCGLALVERTTPLVAEGELPHL